MSAIMPNLNEPRIGKSLANPNGVGVFFAVIRTAVENNKWARQDFDHVKLVEGQIDALEAYFNSSLTDADPVLIDEPVSLEQSISAGVNSTAPEIPAVEQEKKN